MSEFETQNIEPKPQISGTELQMSEFESLFEKSHGYVEETLEKDIETGAPLLEKMGLTPDEALYVIGQLRSFSTSKEGEASIEASSIAKIIQTSADFEARIRELGQ